MTLPLPFRATVLIAALVLPVGCHLVDQTDFGAKPAPPAPDQLAEAMRPNATVPLVAIRYDGGESAYGPALQRAVEMAEARRADPRYEVVAVVPAKGSPAEQVAAAEQAGEDARDVADRLLALGVTAAAIRLSARTEPGLTAREVRVYLR